jgi:type IV pilus assembly protein PilM
MAQSDAVWGIDIGQCSLKALRCRRHEQPDRITADAFDYIEYPQILSAPGVDPVELVRDAMDLFLSRNTVKNDRVAISAPGQAGLAKFIKLPPVEVTKIPDIVRFEARQQIPFDLKREVVWDYQRLEGGAEEEGFVLESQIGLFAMKRDQVFKTLEPFEKAGVDVDIVQLSPMSLYNFVRFDRFHDLQAADYDFEHPPKSQAILAVGAEATDLVVTDGFRIWQRSIPIGGSHFTKALMKELRLTFPKAEHLKRNATSAQDPKVVFQAMRPVFNEFLTEVQRSVGFFGTLERNATIESIVALGNAVKLPGLRKFLEQNLNMPVNRVESFRGLVGSAVATAPAFQENLGSFGVCYGLALQGLEMASLHTNLIPREIVIERLIKAKKPWAVGVAAILLLGWAISFASFSRALGTVDKPRFGDAEESASAEINTAKKLKDQAKDAAQAFDTTDKIGQNLVSNIEGRILWLEVLRGLNQCLPTEKSADPNQWPPIEQRRHLHITGVDCVWVDDLSTWYGGAAQWYQPGPGEAPLEPAAPPAMAPPVVKPPNAFGHAPVPGRPAAPVVHGGPTGPGWVIQLKGKHYHNSEEAGLHLGATYVRETLIAAIQSKEPNVKLPGPSGKDEWVTMHDLGISYPLVRDPSPIQPVTLEDKRADVEPGAVKRTITAREFPFVVQMAWQPMPPSKRLEKRTIPAKNGN